MRRLLGALLVAATCLPAAAPADAREVWLRGSLVPLARFDYQGGTELAFDGRYVFAAQSNDRDALGAQGGVRIIDTLGGRPRLVGQIRCAGWDNDVAVVRPGLIALGYHSASCGEWGDGVTLYDVSDPAAPVQLGDLPLLLSYWSRSHTITAVPGTSYLYVSPGGANPRFRHSSVIDVSDPIRPRLVRRLPIRTHGCHDVSFHRGASRMLGVCTGGDGTLLWDMSNPLQPREISRIVDPEVQFAHAAEISPDGTLLVVNDEAYDGHACGDPTNSTGALHLYDISDPAKPRRVGFVAPPMGRARRGSAYDSSTWCTSHQFNFMPDSRRLVVSWFSGGVSLVDVANPAVPRVLANYRASDSLVWTGHWYAGQVWVNDMTRALEVLAFVPATSRDVPVPLPVPLPFESEPKAGPTTRQPHTPRFLCVVPEVMDRRANRPAAASSS